MACAVLKTRTVQNCVLISRLKRIKWVSGSLFASGQESTASNAKQTSQISASLTSMFLCPTSPHHWFIITQWPIMLCSLLYSLEMHYTPDYHRWCHKSYRMCWKVGVEELCREPWPHPHWTCLGPATTSHTSVAVAVMRSLHNWKAAVPKQFHRPITPHLTLHRWCPISQPHLRW